MTGIGCAIAGTGTALIGSETFTVTTGASGAVTERLRGYNNYDPIGSCVPAASAKYSGATINYIQYSEGNGSPTYMLSIAGAVNDSRWSTLTIDGTTTLNRTSATYVTGGIWVWTTTDAIAANKFGLNGSVHTVVLA